MDSVIFILPETVEQIILVIFIALVVTQYIVGKKERDAKRKEINRLKRINDYLENEIIAKADRKNGES